MHPHVRQLWIRDVQRVAALVHERHLRLEPINLGKSSSVVLLILMLRRGGAEFSIKQR
jgi:hypothetical protein